MLRYSILIVDLSFSHIMTLKEDFVSYTRSLMGEQLYVSFEKALHEPSPVSIRINGMKDGGMLDDAKNGDDSDEMFIGSVPWCDSGRYLKSRPEFTFDPLLHAGTYYVQEASSMFLNTVLKQLVTAPVKMLDLCAAPGGKSTLARAALPEGSLLISNEPIRQRAQILSENMQKFGHEDVIVTNNYAADFKRAGLQFDVILTDVPCSGEGMFRKDEFAVEQWNKELVGKCSSLQREIASEIWPCLKSGGLLIYSTCTFNAHEDEENVAYICSNLGAELLSVNVDEEWNITPSLLPEVCKPVYRFIPGRTVGEGLFMAVMRKTGGETVSAKIKKDKDKHIAKYNKVNSWLNNSDGMTVIQDGDKLISVPDEWADIYRYVRKSLTVLHAGVTVGTVKGTDIVPDESLALSTMLNKNAFPTAELSYSQAITYLRREAITLSADTPRGYVLVTYKKMPLGFVKNLGTRANNLYPAMWKIKSSHLPEKSELFNHK